MINGIISRGSLQYLFCWDVFCCVSRQGIELRIQKAPTPTEPPPKKISLVLAKGTKKRPKTLFTKVAKGSCVYPGVGKGISRTLTGSKPPQTHGFWRERGGFEDKNPRFFNEQFPWLNLNFRRVQCCTYHHQKNQFSQTKMGRFIQNTEIPYITICMNMYEH